MQIEMINNGENVICEQCGYEYNALMQDFHEIIKDSAADSRILEKSSESENQVPNVFQSKNPIKMNEAQQKINEKTIMKSINYQWVTLKDLSESLGISDEREKYMLRMKLNELNKKGRIKMDYQVSKVLIRRAHR